MIVSLVEIVNQAWAVLGGQSAASVAERLHNRSERRRIVAIARDALEADGSVPGSRELKRLLRQDWFIDLLADPTGSKYSLEEIPDSQAAEWFKAVPDPDDRRRAIIAVVGAVWSIAISDSSLTEKLQLALLRQVDKTALRLVDIGLDTFEGLQQIDQRVADLARAVAALGNDARREVIDTMPEYLQELQRGDWDRLTHGLRTALSSANSSVEYALSLLSSGTRSTETTNLLETSLVYMDEVARQVLRGTLQGDRLRVLDIEPRSVVERVAKRLRRFGHATGVSVPIRVATISHARVRTSPEALEFAVHETILNAIQWAPLADAEPVVNVSWRTDAARIALLVSDNGPGFGEVEPELPFSGWRSERATRLRPTGLGQSLRTARLLLRHSGGSLRILADDPGGVVEISMPKGTR